MSSYRARLDTGAAAFSTLVVLVPWKLFEAAGLDEDRAAAYAGVVLAVLAALALAARRAPLSAKSWHVAFARESFDLRRYLRDFAA